MRWEVRESIPGSKEEVNDAPEESELQTTARQQPDKSALHHTGTKQSWYEGGTRPNPLEIGVVLMSFGSTTDFRVNFCKMLVRNKNSSMRTRPSPIQFRFPKNNTHRVSVP